MTSSIKHGFASVAVAIPARDEAAYIASCLRALNGQIGAQIDHVVLCINNTSDGTVDAARQVKLATGTTLHVLEPDLPPGQANAGNARRIAMDMAAGLVGLDGVILTTDADAVVDPDWVAQNIAALREGADAVAGWVDLDRQDWLRIPPKLHEDDARECAYDDLCDAIHATLDPDPADPLPRHTQHSGASIAVTARAYAMVGGMPAVPVGEDRAFFEALRQFDARVRHSPACHVTVSGRVEGRAAGGMADTIKRRLVSPDMFLDDRLEPADDCARRANLRQRLRACFADHALAQAYADDVGLDLGWLLSLLQAGQFGAAWSTLERNSGVLQRRRVAVTDLPAQMARAIDLLDHLRGQASTRRTQDDFEAAA